MLWKYVKACFAILLIIAGIIVTPMPIPFGIFMIAIGLAILVSVSESVREYLKRQRKKFPKFSQSLTKIKPKLPMFIRRLLEDTEPQ